MLVSGFARKSPVVTRVRDTRKKSASTIFGGGFGLPAGSGSEERSKRSSLKASLNY